MEITKDNKWEVYSCIAESMAKEHDIEELSGWLSDLAAELSQWATRCATKGTPYKKHNLMMYIDAMSQVTTLLMAVHHKICKENEELYEAIEKGTMTSFYSEYCSD